MAKPEIGSLENFEYGFQQTAERLRVFTGSLDVPHEAMQYDVELYRIKYHTHYKDDVILASGLVVVPKTTDPVSVISFQHGTIASNEEAPTQLANDNAQLVLYSALASAGFVTVVPDYIGFGASAELMHPYYVEELTTGAIVDNIKAATRLIKKLGITSSGRLYLAGYSQGGYSTLVTHKYAEQDGISGYELVASFPAAGGYDIIGMRDYFFTLEEYHQPIYMAYVARAYQVSFDREENLSLFFNEPYASRIPGLFNGDLTGGEVNENLTYDVRALLKEDFINHEEEDPAYEPFNELFVENSPLNWTPKIPVYFYHGDADITVPYQNSVDVYNSFLGRGASGSVVSLTTLEGATHGSGVTPYIEHFVHKLVEIEGSKQ